MAFSSGISAMRAAIVPVIVRSWPISYAIPAVIQYRRVLRPEGSMRETGSSSAYWYGSPVTPSSGSIDINCAVTGS
jgi:hypothetical protein